MRPLRVALALVLAAGTADGRSHSNSHNNQCRQGEGFCSQWTNHTVNEFSTWDSGSRSWICKFGQAAIGFPGAFVGPNEITMDVSSPAPPPVWQPPVVYGAQSQWAEDNTEAGNCIGCGCECDVAYLCECVSKELADAGNADQLTPLYIFTVIFVLLFVAGLAVFLPGFLQIEAEQAFILGIIEDRKANLAASGAQVANPVALAAAYSVPVPDVTPGMVVTVVVPEGMEPGQQMAVDPDGPEGPLPPVLVTIPEDKKAGDAIQVTCPAPVPVAAPIQAAVPMASGAGMFMVQSKMPGPMGGQKMNVPGALGRTPGMEFQPPPGYDPSKVYPTGPMGSWKLYPMMQDQALQDSALKERLVCKYLSCPMFMGVVAAILLILCVVLQPAEDEYWTGCKGDANGAASAAASATLLAVATACWYLVY